MTDKEKLEKLKKLADAMYDAAQYLTTDASRLHKAMDEYRKFIIYECKEEPVSKVWHDASEKPIKGKIILVVQDNGFPFVCDVRNDIGYVSLSFDHSNKTKIDGKDKWAYIDDLLNLDNFCQSYKNLQEEPVSGNIDFGQELYKAFGQVKDFTLGMQIAKRFYEMGKQHQEPVSENLGEYINELSKQFPEVSFAKLSRIAVRVAKWQKQQDQSTIELAEDHAMLAGMEKMKDDMMAKAIDVEVKVDAGGYPYIPQMELYDYDKDIPLAKAGDKVKVVIFKEE